MINKQELIGKLNDLSLRELDILVAKYFYNAEVKIDRVQSNNSNNIKYLWIPQKRKKYARHFSRSKTKTEKLNDSYRSLPRWSVDIRDCWKLLNEAFRKAYDIKISIDKDKTTVIALGEKFEGLMAHSAVRAILLVTFIRGSNENK